MTIYPLRTKQSADLPDVLIHMTGRMGTPNPKILPQITSMSALERLCAILATRQFIAAPAFDNTWPLVCFSQTTRRALSKLVNERYIPVGLAIHKQAVFDHDGAPAFYVRGDEYDGFRAALPARLAARAVRLWPGSTQETPEAFFITPTQSEWMHEREWRLPAPTPDPWSWSFPMESVAFVILGDAYVSQFAAWAATSSDPWIQNLPIATWQSINNEFIYSGADWV